MRAMTGLNIQSLVLFGDGVIRWHVFIQLLVYYGTRTVRSIIKIFHLLGEGVSNSHPELVSGSHLMRQQIKHNANSPKRTYSPIHLFTHSLKKRAAFTLAEVLITLGIIGVYSC